MLFIVKFGLVMLDWLCRIMGCDRVAVLKELGTRKVYLHKLGKESQKKQKGKKGRSVY